MLTRRGLSLGLPGAGAAAGTGVAGAAAAVAARPAGDTIPATAVSDIEWQFLAADEMREITARIHELRMARHERGGCCDV